MPSTPARPSAPPRPRIRKSPAERRDEISAAASAIALEDGLAAVTLRAIATQVEVAPGLVAHYAPSMDTLVADTFAGVVGRELDEVATLLATVTSPPERMDLLVETLLDGSRDDVTLVWVQAWALGSRNEELAAAVRAQMDAWQRLIEALVVAGVEDGSFATPDPAAVAWHVLAMIDGLNAHSLVRWNDAPDRRELTTLAIAGMLGVAGGRPGPSG